MKRFYIEDTKYGVTEGGIGCGPVSGNTVITVKYRTGKKTQWISLVDVAGTPNVYLTDRDVFDELVKQDFEDQAFSKYIEKSFTDSFEHVPFGSDYCETFECFYRDPELPAIPFVKYLIALVRANKDNVEELINKAVGNYADELGIIVNG